MQEKEKRTLRQHLIFVLLTVLAALFIIPVLFVLMNSFKGKLYISDAPFAIAVEVGKAPQRKVNGRLLVNRPTSRCQVSPRSSVQVSSLDIPLPEESPEITGCELV